MSDKLQTTNYKKVFAIVDCNNFYASCERVFNPKLKDKPIAILSNNDGVIVARTNEVKKFGIPAGAPIFKWEKLLRQHGVLIFSSNYQLYGDMSHRVMASLAQLAPEIEIYSIDEAFLSLERLALRNYDKYCREVKHKVEQWTGIPISIGVAPTKTLAKIANRIAKKIPEHNGVLDLCHNSCTENFLEMTDVGDIWGIGHQNRKYLNMCGIYNALQLRDMPEKWVQKNLTVTGLRTVLELRGISCIELEEAPPPRKQIISSRSYGTPVESLQQLKESVASYIAIAATKLRDQKSTANTLLVYIMTNYFKKSERQYSNSCTLKLPEPTDYTPALTKQAFHALESIYRPGYRYKKAGVALTDISPKDQRQLNIFLQLKSSPKDSALMKAVDFINRSWGRNTIKIAAQGIQQRWKMKQEHRSQSFTTRWDQLLTIKI